MNYASFLIKIIRKPQQSFFVNEISVTEVIGKLYQIKNQKKSEITLHLSLWGNLAYDTIKYYQINDYVIVEGYLSLRNSTYDNYKIPIEKQVELSGFKIYPFLLNNIQLPKINK